MPRQRKVTVRPRKAGEWEYCFKAVYPDKTVKWVTGRFGTKLEANDEGVKAYREFLQNIGSSDTVLDKHDEIIKEYREREKSEISLFSANQQQEESAGPRKALASSDEPPARSESRLQEDTPPCEITHRISVATGGANWWQYSVDVGFSGTVDVRSCRCSSRNEAYSAAYHLLIQRAEMDAPDQKQKLIAEKKKVLALIEDQQPPKDDEQNADAGNQIASNNIEPRTNLENEPVSENQNTAVLLQNTTGNTDLTEGKMLRNVKVETEATNERIENTSTPRTIKFNSSSEGSTDVASSHFDTSKNAKVKPKRKKRRTIKFDISREALQDKGKRADEPYLFLRNWIDSRKESELKDSEKILTDFLLFLDFQNGGGEFYITLSTIARKKGWSEQKAGRVLKSLEELGIIDKETLPISKNGKVIGKKIRIKLKLKFK